ncbi:MAG: 50S ribosomal protein L15 [Magnetococcales bacterium]|nr:50S ribosomal protein L15 [Magnetococcales bacterium]
MRLNQLPAVPGTHQQPKRKGRGYATGNGKTAGRGVKGQKARSGGYHKVGFEGGQMPLQRRLPKHGFKNHFRVSYQLVSVGDLEAKFDAGAEVTVATLREKRLLNRLRLDGIKLLGDGELTKALTVIVDRASRSAVAKVEQAGGKVILPAVPADEPDQPTSAEAAGA